MITTVIPAAMMPIVEACRRMFIKLGTVKKLSATSESTMNMITKASRMPYFEKMAP